MIKINMQYFRVALIGMQLVLFLALIFLPICVNSIKCGGTLCPMYSYCDPTNNHCTCFDVVTPQEEHCGSDGQTYPSLHVLQKTACQNNKTIFVEKKGPCLRCGDSKCHSYSVCKKSINTCTCKPVYEIYGPVCGSDGKTYDSEYQLNHTSCTDNKDIRTLYFGFCKGPGVCGHPDCHKYSICDSLTNKCQCQVSLNTTADYVCGTDGKLYKNFDTLKATACHENRTLEMSYKGKCNQTVPDECKRCHKFSVCDPISRQCYCMAWRNRTKDQVCGTNGETYWNEEALNIVSCQENKTVEVAHRGECKLKSSLDRLTIYILVGLGSFVVTLIIVLTVVFCVRVRRDKKPSSKENAMYNYETPLM